MDHFSAIPSSPLMVGGPQSNKKRFIARSCICGLSTEPQNSPFGTWIWPQSLKNVKHMLKFRDKMAVLTIILPRKAIYGSERSFLLILSARDDLVKVLRKSDARKCQNHVTHLTLTGWLKVASPCDYNYGRVDVDVTFNVDSNTAALFENNLLSWQISDDKIQITLLILGRGALSTRRKQN